MAIVHLILVILALVCFLAAAIESWAKKPAVNLVAAGLFLWLLSTLITSTTTR